jgi:hypothetical protein
VLRKSLPSVCVSVCVSLISLLRNGPVKCILPFIARQRRGKHFAAAKNICKNKELLDACVYESAYSLIVARQQLGKDLPAATKNYWRRRFLCGPCRIKGK